MCATVDPMPSDKANGERYGYDHISYIIHECYKPHNTSIISALNGRGHGMPIRPCTGGANGVPETFRQSLGAPTGCAGVYDP